MALPTMQKKNLDSGAEVDVHGRIQKETVTLDAVSVTRVTFGVGARWSEDLQDYAGTHSCELPHVALVQSGSSRSLWTTAPRSCTARRTL